MSRKGGEGRLQQTQVILQFPPLALGDRVLPKGRPQPPLPPRSTDRLQGE